MIIEAIAYDAACDFIHACENSNGALVEVGATAFVPCITAENEDVYVMFGALGEAALIRKKPIERA